MVAKVNEITRTAVEQAARKHKQAALRNDYGFALLVQEEYNDEVMERVGWRLKERALRLWRQFHPEHFDSDGFFTEEYDELDFPVSEIADRTIERAIANHPDQLGLEEDWQLYSEEIVAALFAPPKPLAVQMEFSL